MADNISFVETDKIDENVQVIMRQTDYTEEVAKEKLKEFNYKFHNLHRIIIIHVCNSFRSHYHFITHI